MHSEPSHFNRPSNSSSDELWAAARRNAYDTYLCALLAPRQVRADLVVLSAFFGEIARVPFIVSEPLLAEVRLQWWRDWLDSMKTVQRLESLPGENEAYTGHNLADAVADIVYRYNLPIEPLAAMLETHSVECYAGIMPDQWALEQHIQTTTGTERHVMAKVRGVETKIDDGKFITAADQAIGRVSLLRRLRHCQSRGYWPFPIDDWSDQRDPASLFKPQNSALLRASIDREFAKARDAGRQAKCLARDVSKAARQSALQLALVEPYLRAFEASIKSEPFPVAEISPLTRVCRLWWANKSGRF